MDKLDTDELDPRGVAQRHPKKTHERGLALELGVADNLEAEEDPTEAHDARPALSREHPERPRGAGRPPVQSLRRGEEVEAERGEARGAERELQAEPLWMSESMLW